LSDPDSVQAAIRGVVGEVLPWLLPIGECPGGNYLCYGLAGHYRDRIWFWDHEHDGPDRPGRLPGTYLVADSLEGFVQSLYRAPETEIDIDSKVVSFWLSDDLLP
jgi:hypothetical protein